MEFLRFGSSIPGAYWGCCAADIIQNFKVDPDAKYAIEVVSGDGGGSTGRYIGKTWKDVFLQRLKIGTFGSNNMPNHAFFAILTEGQINSGPGAKWLKILKEQGFEFLRTVNNSVYSGAGLASSPAAVNNGNDNHIFILIRNVGNQSIKDQFTPPKAWQALPKVVPEMFDLIGKDAVTMTKDIFDIQKGLYSALPDANYLTTDQLQKEDIEPTCAGVRSGQTGWGGYQFVAEGGAPQESLTNRNKRKAERLALRGAAAPANAFPAKATAAK